jgi:hypothetical protein
MCVQRQWRRLVVIVAFLAASGGVSAYGVDGQTTGDQDTGGIDSNVIAAWEGAGARFGWVRRDGSSFPPFSLARPKDGAVLPGFQVRFMKLPVTQELPVPAVPFGLDASYRRDKGFLPNLPGRAQARVLHLSFV